MAVVNRCDMVVAGDVGGTKTVVGTFSLQGERPVPILVESYASAEFPSLEALLDRFIAGSTGTVSGACFGIPGPVVGGRSRLTNLQWEVSEAAVSEHFGWPHVKLINDLSATALGIPALYDSELCKLNAAEPDSAGTIGVLAPGTGLGVSLMVNVGGEYHPVASEGGHVDFAPLNERQLGLWRFLRDRLPHVSIERLISGPGLVTIYSWLRESGGTEEPAWLKQQLARDDPAKVISEAALTGSDPICNEALDEFVSILGASAGNLALTGMTTGGIYLGGGISPKVLERLSSGPFMEAFLAKGRFRELLTRIPVRVILNDKAALLGAARAAFRG